MTRRISLPGAAELYQSTPANPPEQADWFDPATPAEQAPRPPVRPTPRQKHTSKITVYVSDEELLALEHARLALRATHGLAVDRGRVVREAVAVVLADLDEHGEDSVLVRRLRQGTGK
ncbi:hypothetical protein [Actinokineospora iranica]|uniref:Cobyrinic acid a,c-diamide synthase n=1 Tax=Actinokineospora iranica TaxID=1271860 RepID=A0A1G6XIC0_9PSEU|nr:hypothetical protein [Actinokineospora iranica]SDD77105.1 hypothetical protein SAMN05216174_11789 [Actinokineospora iranica]